MKSSPKMTSRFARSTAHFSQIAWITRGVVIALVNVCVRVLLSLVLTHSPTSADIVPRSLAILIVGLVAVIWGGYDAAATVRRQRAAALERDMVVFWLKAAVVAALLSGLLSWLVGHVRSIDIGHNSLFFELTSGAALSLLLAYLPAMLGLSLGTNILKRRDGRRAEREFV